MYKVMIVDDEISVLESLEATLPWEQLGVETVSTATSVDEAIAELRRRPVFQLAEVEFELDDREVRVQRGADVDGTVEYAHVNFPKSGRSALWLQGKHKKRNPPIGAQTQCVCLGETRVPAEAVRVARL